MSEIPGNGSNPAAEGFEPRIVAFLCNWCTYTGADLAGTSRLQYPPSVRIIRLMCSGAVDPVYVCRALAEGADGVLIGGCHIGDCHYIEGNFYARRKFALLKNLMGYTGLEPGRLHFSWISSAEATRYVEVAVEVVEAVRRLGPLRGFRKECSHALLSQT